MRAALADKRSLSCTGVEGSERVALKPCSHCDDLNSRSASESRCVFLAG